MFLSAGIRGIDNHREPAAAEHDDALPSAAWRRLIRKFRIRRAAKFPPLSRQTFGITLMIPD